MVLPYTVCVCPFQALQPHPAVQQPHVRLRLLALQGAFDSPTVTVTVSCQSKEGELVCL